MPHRSFTAMSLVCGYNRLLAAVPDGEYPDDDPIYQPQEILVHNEMCEYSQEVVHCLNCNTVITYHPLENQGECPFCHKVFDKTSAKILKTSPIKALLEAD